MASFFGRQNLRLSDLIAFPSSCRHKLATVLTNAQQRSRKSYLKHRVKVLTRSKERYLRHRFQRVEQGKIWRKNNPQASVSIAKRYREKNREKMRQRTRDWYRNNLEYNRTRKQVYREKLSEKQKVRRKMLARRWYSRNRSCFILATTKRKRLKDSQTVNLPAIKTWMREVLSRPMAKCYYCRSVVLTSQIDFDHVIPLSKGGLHCVSNLCVSCSHCNGSKFNRPFSQWPKRGQMFLSL